MSLNNMEVIKYRPGFQIFFENLNKAWIQKYFELEPSDVEILSDPEGQILDKGGQVFFIKYKNKIIATAALVCVGNGVFELAKMAVDEAFQGIGAGKLLCKTVIEEAKRRQGRQVIIFTNSRLKKAISIYRKFGFKSVPLRGQNYIRADIRLELSFNNHLNWFERRFVFDLELEDFPGLCDRLQLILETLPNTVRGLSDLDLNHKPFGKWSIKEHIGHLWILEPLWQKRFLDIKDGSQTMTVADLNNRATDEGRFNQYDLESLLDLFREERKKTIELLRKFRGTDFQHSINHPRLNQPMRIVDLMSFVADHDEHHLKTIQKIRYGQTRV